MLIIFRDFHYVLQQEINNFLCVPNVRVSTNKKSMTKECVLEAKHVIDMKHSHITHTQKRYDSKNISFLIFDAK